MKVIAVKRIKNDFNKTRSLDKNNEHDSRIITHSKILAELGIDYWPARQQIVQLADKTLNAAGFDCIYPTLEEFDNANINDIQDTWAYFTDDDDWVIKDFSSTIGKYLNPDLDCIVWPHVRYHALLNVITGNNNLVLGYNPTPKLQSNHCLIKINSKFLYDWKPDMLISDKCQHWNLSEYIYDSNNFELINVCNIEDILSLWNNTILSFSWWLHDDTWNLNNIDTLTNLYNEYKTRLPKNIDKLPDYFVDNIKKQQLLFSKL